MNKEDLNKYKENVKFYKENLKSVYADGNVTPAERVWLISLQKKLGLSDFECKNFEAPFTVCLKKDDNKKAFDKLYKFHNCDLFKNDGNLQTEGIDYSMLEYIDLNGTYIELSADSYTGLSEQFAVSVGQSFEDLLDEYGEKHIYDAVKDGKLQVFDASCSHSDMLDWVATKFNLLSSEGFENEYLESLNQNNLKDYLSSLEDKGYLFGKYSTDQIDDDILKVFYEEINDDEDLEFSLFISPVEINRYNHLDLCIKDISHVSDDPYNFYSVSEEYITGYLQERLDNKGFLDSSLSESIVPEMIKSLKQGPVSFDTLPLNIEGCVSVPFLPSSRHKNNHETFLDFSTTVNIKKVSERDFPLAFRCTEFKSFVKNASSLDDLRNGITENDYMTEDIRFFNGSFYKPLAISYGALKSTLTESLPLNLKKEIEFHMPNQYYTGYKNPLYNVETSISDKLTKSKNINKFVNKAKELSSAFLVFDNNFWKKCGEPYYHIEHFGLDNTPACFINYANNDVLKFQNLNNFKKDILAKNVFSSLHKDKMLKYYENTKTKESIQTVKENIEVLRPDLVQFKDISDFKEIKNQNMTLEDIINEEIKDTTSENISSPKDAGELFIKITKDILSYQEKTPGGKNFGIATKIAFAGFKENENNKILLFQYFKELGCNSRETFDRFFEKTFGFTQIQKNINIQNPKQLEIKNPAIEKTRHKTHGYEPEIGR